MRYFYNSNHFFKREPTTKCLYVNFLKKKKDQELWQSWQVEYHLWVCVLSHGMRPQGETEWDNVQQKQNLGSWKADRWIVTQLSKLQNPLLPTKFSEIGISISPSKPKGQGSNKSKIYWKNVFWKVRSLMLFLSLSSRVSAPSYPSRRLEVLFSGYETRAHWTQVSQGRPYWNPKNWVGVYNQCRGQSALFLSCSLESLQERQRKVFFKQNWTAPDRWWWVLNTDKVQHVWDIILNYL